MPSLFHQLDTDSLAKDPNLKFDPQNASAHLGENHPTFQQLKEGLTPEQIEILEATTQVDGFDVDEIPEEEMELVDPETGETYKASEDEYSLDELGFIDPSNLRTITFEAFNTERLDHINSLIADRYNEIGAKRNALLQSGTVGRLEANNINDLLGGQLYDNVVMESFTSSPTKVNYNLVMEEMSTGQQALAAGGVVIGVAILYKLVRWALNAWNKNAVANGSIGANVKNIQERKDRLANADNIITVAQRSFNDAKKRFKSDAKGGMNDEEFNKVIAKVQSVEELNNQARASEFVAAVVDAEAKKNLAPMYSNLWASLITKSAVSFNGGSLNIDKDFISKLQSAAQACHEICNTARAKIEDIDTTAANSAVNTSGDDSYTKSIKVIAEFAKSCGFALSVDNFNAASSEFAQHILTNVVGKLNSPVPDKAYMANVELFSAETFAVVNDDFINDIDAFGKSLERVGGKKANALGLGGKEGSVNVGDNKQRDSRLNEYNKAATNFRGSMNVLRSIHAIRNNVGKGLDALAKALELPEN